MRCFFASKRTGDEKMNINAAYSAGRLTVYLVGELDHHQSRTAIRSIEELLDEYTKAFYNPYAAAASDQVTEVINPKETRAKIALALRTMLSKREVRPAKKHGNMPL